MQASAASSSRCSSTNSSMCGDPISSSPSMQNLSEHGSSPRTSRHALIAATRAAMLPLLSRNAAPVQLPVPQRRLERRRRPQLERLRRLHVVVVVEEQRLRATSPRSLGEHDRLRRSARRPRFGSTCISNPSGRSTPTTCSAVSRDRLLLRAHRRQLAQLRQRGDRVVV